MSSLLLRRAWAVLCALIFTIPIVNVQAGDVPGQDDVLLIIRVTDLMQAQHTVLTPLRVYHRLPDAYLCGAAHRDAHLIRRAGIRATIVDDRPWTEQYAIVGTHPGGIRERNTTGFAYTVLFRSTEFDLIKGPASVFEDLRRAGQTCVEIERNEIPTEECATHLPVGVFDHPDDFIADVIANVSDTMIRSTIQGLGDLGTRYWNNANHDSVSRWVKGRFLTTGITDVALDSFQYSGTWQANVVATIPGGVTPAAELIVGGHHDDMPSSGLAPGADDNASGTAAVVEMARVLKLVNYQPSYTMRFMGYAAEEAGLRGSASYAQRARLANRDIRAMQNYDMIANRYQAPTDNSVYIVWYTTSEAYRDLHATMMRTYTPLLPVSTTSYRSGSDSYSFWQQNYRTVFCIEKNFSPYYHTSNDQLQYLDMTYCANIARSGLAMLLTLDMMPPSVTGLQVRDCGDGTSLYARWDSVQVPDWYRYKVYIGASPGVYTSNTMVTTRWSELDGLTAGVRYYVGVSIVDLAGGEGMITELSGIPQVVPARPAGLWAEPREPGALLTWRANPEMDIRGYNLYRSIDSMSQFSLLNAEPIRDTLWTDTLGTAWPRFYYLTAVDSAGNQSAHSDTVVLGPVVGVGEDARTSPFAFRLLQNFPNPFNPSTQIVYEVGEGGQVELRVYDVLGREVATLVNQVKTPGQYVVVWDAEGTASGVYLARLKSGTAERTMRMMLVR